MFIRPFAVVLGLFLAGPALADRQCIVPTEPAGGLQIACELAAEALQEAGVLDAPLPIRYLPGGVGAVAFNAFTSQRRAEAGTIVAFSEGSLFNLAQGKFGQHDWTEVRWVASIAMDHGAVVVRDDAPWRSLSDLIDALADAPSGIALGGSGTIGGRDWMRASRTVEAAGQDVRVMRFVAFEGGGDCTAALSGRHVQVCMNDVSDTQAAIEAGAPLRILAIYADTRLPGLPDIPTATEQGYAITWPVIRGFYVGPDVSDADYDWWVAAFRRATASPGYAGLLAERYLSPMPLTGEELTRFIREHAQRR